MKLSDTYHRSRIRCSQIGWALLDGPYCIMPPRRMDKFGWLGPVLKVIEEPFGFYRSGTGYSVFVDFTFNRERNFLKPLVRYAEWDRAYEHKIKRVRKWPKVKVRHHVLNNKEQEEVDDLLLALDKSLSRLEYLDGGLITDRSSPHGCYPIGELDMPPRSLRIERRNFCQYIDLALGEYTGLNEEIENAARLIMSYIKHVCEIDDETNYRECYEKNLKEEDLRRGSWYYRPPSV